MRLLLRSSLIRIYTVCHSFYIFWRHYFIVKLNCFILRTTTVAGLGVPIFRVFTVSCIALASSIYYQGDLRDILGVAWNYLIIFKMPGHLTQSVVYLIQMPEVPSSIPGPATYFHFSSSSAVPRKAVVSYLGKFVCLVRANCLRGLSLPRKSVVRLTDCPNMTMVVYI